MSDWLTTDSGDGWGASSNDAGGFGGFSTMSSDTNNNPGEKSKSGCHSCGEDGHISRDCPNKSSAPKSCFKCKSDGHMAKDCDLPDVCRRCGQEGHLSRDCSEEEKTRKVVKDDGTEREIYVPQEAELENLYDVGIRSGINFEKYDKIKVKFSGENPPNPISSFDEANLRQLLTDNVKKSGYLKPTPIQKYAIPTLLAKRDLMGCAQTGSGKTAAFLLPILNSILSDGDDPNTGAVPQTPQAVIVAPTRELAIQIKDQARKFSAGSILKCVVAYGGTSVGYQLSTLQRGCNVLIATPGRLLDFVEKGKVSFEKVKFLVLDEADRMLDMGFMPDIKKIVDSNMPAKGERVTAMFSATFPEEIQHLAKSFLHDYLFAAIGIVGGACSDVEQNFFSVGRFEKRDKLIEILNQAGANRTLVFVDTKKSADFLATVLCSKGFPTTSIHGDRLQRQREEALYDFKSGKFPILVATNVAARGLDIKGVEHVVNFDLPPSIDEYVHRIGRTGRVGNIGKATSFFDSERDGSLAGSLVRILSDNQLEVPDFLGSAANGEKVANDFGGRDVRGGSNAAAEEEEW